MRDCPEVGGKLLLLLLLLVSVVSTAMIGLARQRVCFTERKEGKIKESSRTTCRSICTATKPRERPPERNQPGPHSQ